MNVDTTALEQLLKDLDAACTSVDSAKDCIISGDNMSSIKSNTSIGTATSSINGAKNDISNIINKVDDAQKNALLALMGITEEPDEQYAHGLDLGFDSNFINSSFTTGFESSFEVMSCGILRMGIYSDDEETRKKMAPLVEEKWDQYTRHYGYDLIENNQTYMDYIGEYGSKGLANKYLDYVKECKQEGNSKFDKETVVISKEENKEAYEYIENNHHSAIYEKDENGNLVLKLSDYAAVVKIFNENMSSFNNNVEDLYVYVPDLGDGNDNVGIYLSNEVNSDGSPIYKYVKLNDNSEWIEMNETEINSYIEYAGLDFRNESYTHDYFEENKHTRGFNQFYLNNYDTTMKTYIDYGDLFDTESDIIYKMEKRVIPSMDYRYIYDTDEYKDIANLTSEELDNKIHSININTSETTYFTVSDATQVFYSYPYDDMFKVATNEEKALYIYLYENGYKNSETGEVKTGKDALLAYRKDNEDLINDEIGFNEAEDLLSTIYEADTWGEEIWATVRTTFEGNVDGTVLYGQGFYNAVTLGNDGKMSSTDYKQVYYIQAFASRTPEQIEEAFKNGYISEQEKELYYEMQNVTGFKNVWYKNLYSASVSNGRNLIPMALNKLLPGLGTASSAVSMAGNGTNQYLKEGYTLPQAGLRGVADALIEVGDDLLGPGSNPLGESNKLDVADIFSIDMTDASSLKRGMMNLLNAGLNFGSNVAGNVYEEGIKEPLLGAGADYVILGKTDTLSETLEQATTMEYWVDQLFSAVFMDAETTVAKGLTTGIPTINTSDNNTNGSNNNPFDGLQTTNSVDESTLQNLSDSFQIVQSINNSSRNETAYNKVMTGLQTMTEALQKGAISSNYFINNCNQTMGNYINTVFTSKISDAISRVDSLRNNEEIRTETPDIQGYTESMDELSRLIVSDVVKNNASHVSEIVTAMEKIVTTTKRNSEQLVVNLQKLIQKAQAKVEPAVVNYNDNNDRIEPFRELYNSDVTTEMNDEQRSRYEEQIRNAMRLAYIDVFDTGGVNLSELYTNISSILHGEGSIDEKLDGLESYNNDRNNNITTTTLISGTIKQIIESSMKTVNETITEQEEIEVIEEEDRWKNDAEIVSNDDGTFTVITKYGEKINVSQEALNSQNLEYIVSKLNEEYEANLVNDWILNHVNNIDTLLNDQNIEMLHRTLSKKAKRFNIGVEELKEKIAKALKRVVDTSDIGIRVSNNALLNILESGRIKNIHETDSTTMATPEMRKKFEESFMGIPQQIDGIDSPIYGLLLPKLDGSDDMNTENYYRNGPGCTYGSSFFGGKSEAIIVFDKSKIIGHTTFTMGDSLEFGSYNYDEGSGLQYRTGSIKAPFPALNPYYTGGTLLRNITSVEQLETANLYTFTPVENDDTDSYIEAQIHGRYSHSIDNIERVIFLEEPSADILIKLKELGINYTILKNYNND